MPGKNESRVFSINSNALERVLPDVQCPPVDDFLLKARHPH